MNETEERVVDILTSFPPGDRPWGEPISAVMRAMKWDSAKTKAYVEYLMHRKYVVLKTDEPNVGEQEIQRKGSRLCGRPARFPGKITA